MNGSWSPTALPALCALAALFEIDAVHAGQWMVSRPIALGPLFGAACGAPELGMAAGALVELFCVDALPIGNAMPVNGAVAVVLFILLSAGPDKTPPAAAFPAALVLGSLHRRAETVVRSRRAGLTRLADSAVEEGREIPFGRILALGLGIHALMTAGFLYVGVLALGPALAWGWDAVPAGGRRGFQLAFEAAPWLGLAGLMHALRPKG